MIFNINGEIVDKTQPVFTAVSRGYRYGDGFFESMRYSNGQLLHGELHFSRMLKTALLLKVQLPEDFNLNQMQLWVKETAQASNMSHARVRCTIFRESGGLYTPLNSEIAIVLELNPAESGQYEWNERGLVLGTFKELAKNGNYLSLLKTTSSLINVMAGIYARDNNFDECVIYNESGRIAECIGSNIFVFNGEFINTPPLSEYCVDGVMRKVLINLAEAYGYKVAEQPLSDITLNSAHEIFLSSATRGIRWVGQFEGKTYRHAVSKVLYERLNSGFSA